MIGELRLVGSEELGTQVFDHQQNVDFEIGLKQSGVHLMHSVMKDCVVSHDENGDARSKYSDDIWDFSAYDLAVGDQHVKMLFGKLPHPIRNEVKWVMFVLLYLHAWDSKNVMRVGTSIRYCMAVRRLGWFAHERNISLFDVFANEEHLVAAAGAMTSGTLMRGMAAVVKHLHLVGTESCGIKTVQSKKFLELKKAKISRQNSQQVAVIPARIFSNLIASLTEFETEIKDNISEICTFFVGVSKHAQMRRQHSTPKSYFANYDFKSRLFESEVAASGLTEIFEKYGISSPRKLKQFVVKIQHYGKTMIHIYSGMRSQEAFSLKVGCLGKIDMSAGVLYELSGDTSKLTGGKKGVKWVTSENVVTAVEILELIATSINEFAGLPDDDIPLFLSTNYGEIIGKPECKDNRPLSAKFVYEPEKIFSILDGREFAVCEQDLIQLNKVNPFRAWSAEDKFKEGDIWRFTSHQFRRSLAFYVSQSGLVSLTTLKRQLQHLSRNMTIYYAQAVDLDEGYDADQHFIHLLRGTKPEADAAMFLSEIINSDEKLEGPQGRVVEKGLVAEFKNVILDSPKNELVVKVRRGEVNYKETALGACTSPNACDKRALRIFSACVGCKDAVIKKSKLQNLINHQRDFVDELELGSVERKIEQAELDALTKFLLQISKESV